MTPPVDPRTLTPSQVVWLLTVDHLNGRRPSHDVQLAVAVTLLADLVDAGALRRDDDGVALSESPAPPEPWLVRSLERFGRYAGGQPVRWELALGPLARDAWDEVASSLVDSGWSEREDGRWFGWGAPRYASVPGASLSTLRAEIEAALRHPADAGARSRRVVTGAVVSGCLSTLLRPEGWSAGSEIEEQGRVLSERDPLVTPLRRTLAHSDGWQTVGRGPRP